MYPLAPQNLTITKNEAAYDRNVVEFQWNRVPSAKEYKVTMRKITNQGTSSPLKGQTSENNYKFNRGITPCANYEIEILIEFENRTHSKSSLEFEAAMDSEN